MRGAVQDKDRSTSYSSHIRTELSHNTFKLFKGYTVQLMQTGLYKPSHLGLTPVMPTVSLNYYPVQHCKCKKCPYQSEQPRKVTGLRISSRRKVHNSFTSCKGLFCFGFVTFSLRKTKQELSSYRIIFQRQYCSLQTHTSSLGCSQTAPLSVDVLHLPNKDQKYPTGALTCSSVATHCSTNL